MTTTIVLTEDVFPDASLTVRVTCEVRGGEWR